MQQPIRVSDRMDSKKASMARTALRWLLCGVRGGAFEVASFPIVRTTSVYLLPPWIRVGLGVASHRATLQILVWMGVRNHDLLARLRLIAGSTGAR
jgi:hypothetical protein